MSLLKTEGDQLGGHLNPVAASGKRIVAQIGQFHLTARSPQHKLMVYYLP